MQDYPPLPSDGVPCVIDDGPRPAEYPCNCTDHRVARRVEVERAILVATNVDADLDSVRPVNVAPAKRRRSAR